MTYNILLGAVGREDAVRDVLKRLNADIIALQEASNPRLVERIASDLGMEAVIAPPSDDSTMNMAMLSRLPIAASHVRRHQGRMLRSHLDCEIEVSGELGPVIRVHCVHLAARFGERAKGEARRIRELNAVMSGVERSPHVPHLVLGDFNALAPGDPVEATRFFRRMAELRRAGLVVPRDGYLAPRPRGKHNDEEIDAEWRAVGIDPRLEIGIPRLPGIVASLGRVPQSDRLDRVLGGRVERWTITRMDELGYVDCYRVRHPRARGYTCATWLPAARIDYIFASPDAAPHLVSCEVVGSRGRPDPIAASASDHFPVVADFRLGASPTKKRRRVS